MIKSTNSFYLFSKEYQTYFRDNSTEPFEKPQNPATLMDSFLRSSSFAKKSMKPLDWPSEIDMSSIREEYLIIDPNQRFQREWNEKKLFFKHRQSPFRTESYNRFRDSIRSLSKTYKIEKDNIEYTQQGTIPSERKNELQQLIDAQKEYKEKKQKFQMINKQFRLIENLHHDDVVEHPKMQQKLQTESNERLTDWPRKKKPLKKLDTFHRVIAQEDNEHTKLGQNKPNRVKQFEIRGRDYNIVNFVTT